MLDLKRLGTKVQKTLRVQRLSATTGVKFTDCYFEFLEHPSCLLSGKTAYHKNQINLNVIIFDGEFGNKYLHNF